MDETIPYWVLRNLKDYNNCAIDFKTFVGEGLEAKLSKLYSDLKIRYVETNEGNWKHDLHPMYERTRIMVYISVNGK